MSKKQKRLATTRNNPSDVRFDDLVALILSLGFVPVRQAGSHVIYQHRSHPASLVNLQTTKDGKAKTYQVEQLLALVDSLKLEVK